MNHLLVALSSHGYGHAAQTAVVVNALRQRRPNLQLTLRTALPREYLARRFVGEFAYLPCLTDVGVVMKTALDTDVPATAEAYRRFHTDWDSRISEEADELSNLAPNLVLSNASYRILEASARAAIPALGLCSLNWADIYAHYFPARFPEAARVHEQILASYHHADCFLQAEPSMPMATLPHRVTIGPVAERGVNRRAELKARLGLTERDRLVAVALGGIDIHLPFEDWPRSMDIHWLLPASWGVSRPDASTVESLGVSFTDVLSSVDALVGKPGYGSFVEAACIGTPVLYTRRRDWPEEPYLVEWLQRQGNCLEIDRQQLERGDFVNALHKLWGQPLRSPVTPTGIEQAVELLDARLQGDRDFR